MTEHDVATLVEFGEVNAWADMYLSAPPALTEELGLRVEHFGSAVARRMGSINMAFFNSVIGLGVIEPATEEMVDAIVAFYSEAGVEFMVQLSPAAQPAELPDWLEARGVKRSRNWVKVFRGVEPPPEINSDIRIEQVGPDLAAVFAETAFTGYEFPPFFRPIIPWLSLQIGRPGWFHYLGFDGDMPVSTGGLYVRDGVGWLGYGSTLPSHRRRGGQGAMFARRITDAIAQGCHRLVTETGEETAEEPNPSLHNMLRVGFEVAYLRPNFVFRADPDS